MRKEEPTIEQLSDRLIEAKQKHALALAATEAATKAHEKSRVDFDTASKALSEADKALTAALATAARDAIAAGSTTTSTSTTTATA